MTPENEEDDVECPDSDDGCHCSCVPDGYACCWCGSSEPEEED